MAEGDPQKEPSGRLAPEPVRRPTPPTVEATAALNVPLPGDDRAYVFWVEALRAGIRVGSRPPAPADMKAECRREAEKLMPAEGAGFGLWALIIVPAVTAVFMGLLAAELIGNGSGEPERVGIIAVILTVLILLLLTASVWGVLKFYQWIRNHRESIGWLADVAYYRALDAARRPQLEVPSP